MADLEAIAKQRCTEPMSTWPAHEDYHVRTIMYARLFDEQCLRCWIEKVASEAAHA